MGYAWDREERNEIYASERDEERGARRGLSELQRSEACGHSSRNRGGTCYDCHEGIDDDRGDQ